MARKGLTAFDKKFSKKFTDRDGDSILVKAKEVRDWDFFPSDSPSLNTAMGSAIPLGSIITVGGKESSAKSALCLNLIGSCQRSISKSGKKDMDGDLVTSGMTALLDIENSYTHEWSARLGIDIGLKRGKNGEWEPNGSDNFRVIQSNEGELTMDLLIQMVDSGEYDFIVCDSVTALLNTADGVEESLEDQKMALLARLMSRALKKLKGICRKRQTTVIFISQLRSNMEKYQTFIEKLSAGASLAFYSDIIMKVSRTEWIGDKDAPDGIVSEITCVKNKVSKPGKKASFSLYYDSGMSYELDYIDTAIQLHYDPKQKGGPRKLDDDRTDDLTPVHFVKASGAWFTLMDEKGEPIFVIPGATKAAVQGKKKFLDAVIDSGNLEELKNRLEGYQLNLPSSEEIEISGEAP